MNIPHRLLCLSLAALGLVSTVRRAVADDVVITSVPYVITASGHYKLNGNLNSSAAGQPAITVAAPSVILDLNGYFVTGTYNSAATGAQNSAIYVGDVANVTIRNGLVAGGSYGICFGSNTAANARNYVVDSVVATRCYFYGFYIQHAVSGSQIRNCSCSLIGNATTGSPQNAIGIVTNGGVRVENNNIGTVTANPGAATAGIQAATGDFVVANTISGCTYGVLGGKYRDNLTSGVGTPVASGTDAGGNN